jgi:hypothetical protein
MRGAKRYSGYVFIYDGTCMTDCRAALEDSLTVSLKKRRAEVKRKHKRL